MTPETQTLASALAHRIVRDWCELDEWNWGWLMEYPECAYCGASPELQRRYGGLTEDHEIAYLQGGFDAVHNVVACCRACNSSKSNRPPEAWLLAKHGLAGVARLARFKTWRDAILTTVGVPKRHTTICVLLRVA